jgi:hypothetical protein
VEKGINPPVPSYITGLAGRLQGLPGATVTLDSDGPGCWLLCVTGERVTLEAHYDLSNGTGAWVTIDGRTSKFLGDETEFLRLWADPDGFKDGLMSVPGSYGALPPAEVQHFAAVVRSKSHYDIRAGFDGVKWIVGADFDGGGMRVIFYRHGRRWQMMSGHSIQMVKDGEDLGSQAGGSIEEAIRLLVAMSAGASSAGASPVGAADAKASNAVTARRSAVIRN